MWKGKSGLWMELFFSEMSVEFFGVFGRKKRQCSMQNQNIVPMLVF